MQTIGYTYTSIELMLLFSAFIVVICFLLVLVDYTNKRSDERFNRVKTQAKTLGIPVNRIDSIIALKLLQEEIGTSRTLEFLLDHFNLEK